MSYIFLNTTQRKSEISNVRLVLRKSDKQFFATFHRYSVIHIYDKRKTQMTWDNCKRFICMFRCSLFYSFEHR